MQNNVSYKNILITGAASGLGKILAQKFSRFKTNLILIDINEKALLELKEELKELPSSVDTHIIDLSDTSNIGQHLKTIQNNYPHIDLLINNAGIVFSEKITNINQNHLEKTFAINTLSPILLINFFLPEMIKKNNGHIVNITSASSFTGVPKLSTYAASKAALENFNESLRLEVQESAKNITITSVAPFFIDTGMFKGVKTKFPSLLPILDPETVASKIFEAIIKRKPRVITPLFVYSVFLLKIFPVKIYDTLLKFFGINSAMDNFKGRD